MIFHIRAFYSSPNLLQLRNRLHGIGGRKDKISRDQRARAGLVEEGRVRLIDNVVEFWNVAITL